MNILVQFLRVFVPIWTFTSTVFIICVLISTLVFWAHHGLPPSFTHNILVPPSSTFPILSKLFLQSNSYAFGPHHWEVTVMTPLISPSVSVRQAFWCWDKIKTRKRQLQKKSLICLLFSEVSIHCQLALLLLSQSWDDTSCESEWGRTK